MQKGQSRRVKSLFKREFCRQYIDLVMKFLRSAPSLKLFTLDPQLVVGKFGRCGVCYCHLSHVRGCRRASYF